MNPEQSFPASDGARMREWVSAWVDGQPDALDEACRAWSSDAQARRVWHEYHLIGDVLRSEDLTSTAVRDEAFLLGLRQRLAAEPIVLAPAVQPAAASAGARPSSRRWAVAAAAAGVMLVGGAVMSLDRLGSPVDMAGAPVSPKVATSPQGIPSPASGALGDPQWQVVDGKMIRDARLDAYLRAHRGGQAARPGAVSGRFENVVFER